MTTQVIKPNYFYFFCSPGSLINQEPMVDEDDGNEEESLELQEVIIDKQPQVMWVVFKTCLM